MHYTVFTWRKKELRGKEEDWWRKWRRCVLLGPEMPSPQPLSVLTCTRWCQEKVFNHHLWKMQLCHCCAAVRERSSPSEQENVGYRRQIKQCDMYSGLRLCADSLGKTLQKENNPKYPVVYPLSTSAAAWAGDHHQGHHSPIVIAGSTIVLSKGGSNKSFSPSGVGEEPWPTSPTQTRGASEPAEGRRVSRSESSKAGSLRSGGNQWDKWDVAMISGFTDT